MSDAFDPYYIWLGIPPGEQSPDHYRLLGIAQFESNADVIRNAAEQRMRYLRTVTGPRAKRLQQLINEIVSAQRVLSEGDARDKYNALITESPLSRRRPSPSPSTRTAAFKPPSIDTLDTRSRRRRGGKRGRSRTKDQTTEKAKNLNLHWWVIIGMSSGFLILTLMMTFSSGNHAKKEKVLQVEIAKKRD